MSEHEATEELLEELASLPTLAHPTASPDGTEIAFYYDTTGRNELHVVDVESHSGVTGRFPGTRAGPSTGRQTATGFSSTSTMPGTSRTTSTLSRVMARPSRSSRWTDR